MLKWKTVLISWIDTYNQSNVKANHAAAAFELQMDANVV